MIEVTAQIIKFRDFLVHSWNDLDLLMANHDWDDDGSFISQWLQVNWEFLVERELLEKKGFLKSYSNLDFRITHRDALPTHEIICSSKENKQLVDDKTQYIIPATTTLVFGGFVKKIQGGYGCYPPFDFVTAFIQNKRQYYRIPVVDIDFYMCPLDSLQT